MTEPTMDVVVLCGSARYPAELAAAEKDLTLAGNLVFGITPYPGLTDADTARLDEAHRRKIDLAARVVVVNPGGYVGPSTRGEIAYAESQGKPIEYLTPVTATTWPTEARAALHRALSDRYAYDQSGPTATALAVLAPYRVRIVGVREDVVAAREAAAEQRALLDLADYARTAARQVGEGEPFLDGAHSAFLDIAQEAERRAAAVAGASRRPSGANNEEATP